MRFPGDDGISTEEKHEIWYRKAKKQTNKHSASKGKANWYCLRRSFGWFHCIIFKLFISLFSFVFVPRHFLRKTVPIYTMCYKATHCCSKTMSAHDDVFVVGNLFIFLFLAYKDIFRRHSYGLSICWDIIHTNMPSYDTYNNFLFSPGEQKNDYKVRLDV